jgi:hypothetical protein
LWTPEPAERDARYRAANDAIFRRLGLSPLTEGPHVRLLFMTAFSGIYAFGLIAQQNIPPVLEVAWTNHQEPWDMYLDLIRSGTVREQPPGIWDEMAELVALGSEEAAALWEQAAQLKTWPRVERGYDGYYLEFEWSGLGERRAFHAWSPENKSYPGLLPFLRHMSRLVATRVEAPDLARRLTTLHDCWLDGQPLLSPPPISKKGKRR